MASISEVEAKFKTLKKQYDTNIKGHVASAYEESKIHSQDSVFIKYLEDLGEKISNFRLDFGKIQPPMNYNNTWHFIDDIINNSATGNAQVTDSKAKVETASKEVFQEYVEKFKGLDNKYRGSIQSISNALVQAKEAESKYNEYNANADAQARINASSTEKSTTPWRSMAIEARNTRDKIVSTISTKYLPTMSDTIKEIEALLDRGLGKG